MSPLQIQILLHYHAFADDFRGGDFSSPVVRDEIDAFYSNDMLVSDNSSFPRKYKLGPRGEYFVDYICSLPLPIQKWEMPK